MPEPDDGGASAAESEPTRLVVIIASSKDAGRLADEMVRRGLPLTKIGSTGGFLRRGNITLLSGVPADRVDEVIALVRDECHARREVIPVQALPFLGESGLGAEPIRVRVGGATVFVLEVARFERA